MFNTIDRSKFEKVRVVSSNLESIGYKDNCLLVEFKNGGEYLYLDVPSDEYIRLLESQSLGKYFMSNIRNKYRCIKF